MLIAFPTFVETSTSKEILLYIPTDCSAHGGRLFFRSRYAPGLTVCFLSLDFSLFPFVIPENP